MSTTPTKAKADEKAEPNDNSNVKPVEQDPSMTEIAEQAEDTGLVKLAEDNGDNGLVFEANRRETAKIKDEPEPDTSDYVRLVIAGSAFDSFTGHVGESSYTIEGGVYGSLVPPKTVPDLIEQAAMRGVALSTKGA